MKIDRAKAALVTNRKKAPNLSVWTHLKSGTTYVVEMHVLVESSLQPAVVYRQKSKGAVITWCRPASEFFDGRFEKTQ